LLELIEVLKLNKPILVSPSMSGGYSLPFVVKHAYKLGGFIPIVPVNIEEHEQGLEGIELPTMAIWGSNDRLGGELGITFQPSHSEPDSRFSPQEATG